MRLSVYFDVAMHRTKPVAWKKYWDTIPCNYPVPYDLIPCIPFSKPANSRFGIIDGGMFSFLYECFYVATID